MESLTQSVVGNYLCDMPIYMLPKLKNLSYGMAVTACIFSYFFSSAIIQKTQYSGPTTNIFWITGSWVLITIIQFVTNNIQFAYAKCSVSFVGSLISWLVGTSIGVLTFGLVAVVAPDELPFIISGESFTTMALNGGLGGPPPTKVVKDDASISSSVEKSSKPDDKDEFVCDLYKNGQLITSTVSE